jgi:predicted TIM-barrel enzyme
MFGNENDRPYEFKADTASTATMAFVIGARSSEIKAPFGVNVLREPMSMIALAAATGASFVREIFTGAYASDMGLWNPDAGAALRCRDRLRRSVADRARSAVFSSTLFLRRADADPRSARKGVIFGLNLTHTRGDVVRAALEGIAFGTRHALDKFTGTGVPVVNIYAVGGGVKNAVWAQSTSDISGIGQIV